MRGPAHYIAAQTRRNPLMAISLFKKGFKPEQVKANFLSEVGGAHSCNRQLLIVLDSDCQVIW